MKLPSLSMSRGQVPVPEGGPSLGRRLRSYVGWGAVAMAFFLLFAWLCLPTRAIAWRISHEARKAGFIIDVKDVSVGLLGGITLEEVTWTFKPSRPDQVPGSFFVKEVDIDVSLLSLLLGNVDVDVEARRDEGKITAHYERDSSSSKVQVQVEDLPLYDVPKARQALNTQLLGLFALKIDLEMPGNKFAKANGTIEVTCAGCRIGDGESRLFIPGSKGLKDGTVIPEIDLGTFVGKMIVDKGVAKTDGLMETKSDDVELSVEGEIALKDPFRKSRFDLVVKLNLTEALQKRSEKLRLVFQSADPKARLDPPEVGLAYVLSGPLSKPSFKGIKAKSATDSRNDKRAKARARDEARKAKERAKADAKEAKEAKAKPSLPPLSPSAAAGMPDPNANVGGAAGTAAGGPTTTVPAPNGFDVQNVPVPNGVGPGTGVQPQPPPGEPPIPPPAAEPPPEPEPQPEPPPPEEPADEVPTILPSDGNFGGSGGPQGEPIGEPVP
jgi:type II secretion system protein N